MQDLPEEFPSPATCWWRLRDWEEQEVWLEIWRAFLTELSERQQLKWSEAYLDGSFCAGEKRGCGVGKTKRGEGTPSAFAFSAASIFRAAAVASVALSPTDFQRRLPPGVNLR